ncbi:ribonuclease HII [Candidatus Azambacteria bacterium]|nr:ribonuclease HII [Candidatus Azambacteria bacterium]
MKNYKYYIGIDEVGRGALAGPITAVAVLSDSLKKIFKGPIKDSKKLSEKRREELFKILDEKFVWGLGQVSEKMIDQIGIEKANFLVMEKAVNNLLKKKEIDLKETLLLIDGNRMNSYKLLTTNYKLIVKGDEKISLIASASILAKVSRDNLMKQFHQEQPSYYWCDNKGYGTKAHFEMIEKYGLSEHHRN